MKHSESPANAPARHSLRDSKRRRLLSMAAGTEARPRVTAVAPPGVSGTRAAPSEAHLRAKPKGQTWPLPDVSPDLTATVAANLHRLRVKRGLSLQRLAHASGVSRAMLGQIELQQSTPTINVLWKIAHAMQVPFSALISDPAAGGTKVLSAAHARVLKSQDGRFSSRALFPFEGLHSAEFYELRLAPLTTEHAEPHPPGTVENLVVASGSLVVHIANDHYRLAIGDAIQFEADVRHEYCNPTDSDVVVYLVMTYAERYR